MNLTITVDREILKRARIRALEEHTSVSAVLRGCLEVYAAGKPPQRRREAVERLLTLSRTTGAGRGNATWTRDELHGR